MSEQFTHNPRLPLPADILPLNPNALMLDGVEGIELGVAVGFWTPREEQCQTLIENGTPLVQMARVPEIFNQLAAYTLMHGYRESRLPYLTGVDNLQGKHPISVGEIVRIVVNVDSPDHRTYKAKGELRRQLGEIAYSGTALGVLLQEGETWEDSSTEAYVARPQPPARAPRRHRPYNETRPHELYQRVIDISRIPQVRPKPDAPKVHFSVESDNQINLNDKVISLSGHKLFIVNALLLNLGRDISRADVEEMGFGEDITPASRQAAFSQYRRYLDDNIVAGDPLKPLIRQRYLGGNRKGHFQLDPKYEYVFTDKRVTEADEPAPPSN